jgi:hypothetical protein
LAVVDRQVAPCLLFLIWSFWDAFWPLAVYYTLLADSKWWSSLLLPSAADHEAAERAHRQVHTYTLTHSLLSSSDTWSLKHLQSGFSSPWILTDNPFLRLPLPGRHEFSHTGAD